MMRVSLRAFVALAVWAGFASAQIGSANTTCSDVEGTIYDFSLEELTGEMFDMDEYQGKVLVIFNSATYCGLYEQYIHWNAVKAEINDSNFDVLAIPTNHFNLQEPGANDVILSGLEFVRPGDGFVPNYRVAGKTNCNGAQEEPLFSLLKGACPGTTLVIGPTEQFYFTPIKQHDITWNFEKFLVSGEGKPVRRYNPTTSPFNMQADIREQLDLLKAKKQEEQDVRKSRVLKGMTEKLRNKTKQ